MWIYGFFWGFVLGIVSMLWYFISLSKKGGVGEKMVRPIYPDGASIPPPVANDKKWEVKDRKVISNVPEGTTAINEVYATKEEWERFRIDREAYRFANGLQEREPGNLLFCDWKKQQKWIG